MNQPRTILLPTYKVRAGLDEAAWPVVELGDALRASYPGKASLLPYAPVDPDVAEHPRLRKADLVYFLGDSPAVQLQALLVDLDYEDHQVPPDDWHHDQLAKLPPALRDVFAWYRTPHGLRLVAVPSEPIPLQYADDFIARWYTRLADYGLDVDLTVTDWTRLSKAPRALRLDLPMDLTALSSGATLPPLGGAPLAAAEPSSLGSPVHRTQPAADSEVRRITRADVAGIRPKGLADDVYHGRVAAPKGERHRHFLTVACRIAASLDCTDPLILWELLARSATACAFPLDELWGVCAWVAAAQAGAVEEEKKQTVDLAERAAEAMDCQESEVRGRLLVDTGQGFFIWDEEEHRYIDSYTKDSQMWAAIVKHCPRLYGIGDVEKTTPAELRVGRSVVPQQVTYTYTTPARPYDDDTRVFYHQVCHQDPTLRPRRSEAVQGWLDLILDGTPGAMDWLARFPDLSASLCALYVDGDPSVGKGLLTRGLARLFDRASTTVKYKELLGDFNGSLLQSPLIVADESVPQDAFRVNDSSLFRQLIGNGSKTLRALYKAPATLVGHNRVLITANNPDGLRIREELDAADLAALRVRLGYVRANPMAHDYLVEYARSQGHASIWPATDAWVEGGEIAEHVLWLAANRRVRAGSRFAVDGWPSELTANLQISVGGAPDVAAAVCLAIAKRHRGTAVAWDSDYVYVNQNALAAEWSTILGHNVDKAPSQSARQKALRSLAEGYSVRRRTASGSQLRYWAITHNVIVRAAAKRGDVEVLDIQAALAEPSPTGMVPVPTAHGDTQ